MKKIAFLGALVVSAFVAMGCQTVVPFDGGANGKVGGKTGQATCKMLLGLPLGAGDASVATAAKNGGISQVGTVDLKVRWPLSPALPIIMEVTTIVTGD